MKLLKQILEDEGADLSCAYVIIPDFGVYLKNVNCITDYAVTKIKIKIAKKFVTIEGDDMTIGKFFEGDLLILGKVRSLLIE